MVNLSFLSGILTPTALASVEADPTPLITFGLAQAALTAIGVGAWYISFVTSKPYNKPGQKKEGMFVGALNQVKGLVGIKPAAKKEGGAARR